MTGDLNEVNALNAPVSVSVCDTLVTYSHNATRLINKQSRSSALYHSCRPCAVFQHTCCDHNMLSRLAPSEASYWLVNKAVHWSKKQSTDSSWLTDLRVATSQGLPALINSNLTFRLRIHKLDTDTSCGTLVTYSHDATRFNSRQFWKRSGLLYLLHDPILSSGVPLGIRCV